MFRTQAIGAAEDSTAVCLPADPPAHGRQKERMVNLCQNSGLAAAHNDCPCRYCSPWDRYAQANETRSACVKSQLICS